MEYRMVRAGSTESFPIDLDNDEVTTDPYQPIGMHTTLLEDGDTSIRTKDDPCSMSLQGHPASRSGRAHYGCQSSTYIKSDSDSDCYEVPPPNPKPQKTSRQAQHQESSKNVTSEFFQEEFDFNDSTQPLPWKKAQYEDEDDDYDDDIQVISLIRQSKYY